MKLLRNFRNNKHSNKAVHLLNQTTAVGATNLICNFNQNT